jgi:hypothetical protein
VIEARFVPVDVWPGKPTPSYAQKSAPFRATYIKTLDLLEKELDYLFAKETLIQGHWRREDIRNDGWPKSSARPSQSGLILTFQSRGSSMSFPCDRFNAWEDNLRAIALSLEALRMIDRFGVTRNNEQYKGFAALPAADPNQERTIAIAFFSKATGWSEDQVRSDLQGAYRLAARMFHPDSGGSHEKFVAVQKHWEAAR